MVINTHSLILLNMGSHTRMRMRHLNVFRNCTKSHTLQRARSRLVTLRDVYSRKCRNNTLQCLQFWDFAKGELRRTTGGRTRLQIWTVNRDVRVKLPPYGSSWPAPIAVWVRIREFPEWSWEFSLRVPWRLCDIVRLGCVMGVGCRISWECSDKQENCVHIPTRHGAFFLASRKYSIIWVSFLFWCMTDKLDADGSPFDKILK